MARRTRWILAAVVTGGLTIGCSAGGGDRAPAGSAGQVESSESPGGPCGREGAYRDRDQWYDDALTLRISHTDGELSGDTGTHEATWSQLVQVIVRSDVGLDIEHAASGQTGTVGAGGQTTLTFPADELGTSDVTAGDGQVLATLDVSC